MTNKKLKNLIKGKNIDYEAVKELNLTIENEYDDYQTENALTKNYAKKYNKGKFNFQLAHKGVLNNIVTPRARKYNKEWGVKIGTPERNEIAKARLREIMRRIRENEY